VATLGDKKVYNASGEFGFKSSIFGRIFQSSQRLDNHRALERLQSQLGSVYGDDTVKHVMSQTIGQDIYSGAKALRGRDIKVLVQSLEKGQRGQEILGDFNQKAVNLTETTGQELGRDLSLALTKPLESEKSEEVLSLLTKASDLFLPFALEDSPDSKIHLDPLPVIQ
jgi:hypothetical protein